MGKVLSSSGGREFEALTVGHDDIRVRNRCPVENHGIDSSLVTVVLRFHHTSGAKVSQNGSSLFDLHHTGEELCGRGRLAVHQHHELASEWMAMELGDHRFLLRSADAVSDLYFLFEAAADQILKGFDAATGVPAQIEDERLVLARFADHAVDLRLGKVEFRKLQDTDVVAQFGESGTSKMLVALLLPDQVPHIIAVVHTGQIHDALRFFFGGGNVQSALLTGRIAQVQCQAILRAACYKRIPSSRSFLDSECSLPALPTRRPASCPFFPRRCLA